MGEGGHGGGKEVAGDVDPVAAEGVYLANQGVEGVPGMGIPYVSGDERACLQGGFERFDEWEGGPVEGDDEDVVEHASAAYFFENGFCDVWVVAEDAMASAGFDFDVGLDMTSGEVQYFSQGRYLLWFGPATWEVGGGVEAAQVSEVEVEYVAGAVGATVDGVVVKDDGVAVSAHVYVEFDGVDG